MSAFSDQGIEVEIKKEEGFELPCFCLADL
jgi:hypothetical protein